MENIKDLKTSLTEIKRKYNLLRKAAKKDKADLETELTSMADNMIVQFDLNKYDAGIADERHKTNLFISDVEFIILRVERDSDN